MSPYHESKLSKTLHKIDVTLKPTRYDRELYMFNNTLDNETKYHKILNFHPIKLGEVTIEKNGMIVPFEDMDKQIDEYYNKHFKLNYGQKDYGMDKIVQLYIDGLVWTFEHYFNDYDEKRHRDYAKTWTYNYEFAPLLTQIYQNLKKNRSNPNYIEKIFTRVNSKKVERKDYFNSVEHLLYTSPGYNESYIPVWMI
jgi:hypothetical protein